MTPRFVQAQQGAERLNGKVNNIVKARLLKHNVKQTKLLKNGKVKSDAGVIVDDDQMEVVEHFKYIGSLTSPDGNVVDPELEWPRK